MSTPFRLILGVALSAVALAARAQEEPRPDSSELLRLIEEQRRMIEAQGRELERQGRELAEMRQRLDAGGAAVPAAPATPAPVAGTPAAPATPPPPSNAAADNYVNRLPEEQGRVVTIDDFRGSLAIPGTSARIRLGGWVRTTYVHRFEPMGSDDRFTASSIAVGEPTPAQTTGSTFTAQPTRLSLDLRTPTGVGAMRAYVETDFDSDTGGGAPTVRLRHAYGRWGKLLIGQTWSAFSDVKAEPDSIDAGGFGSSVHLRQPGLRFTMTPGQHTSLAFALESADPSITGGVGLSELPDAFVTLVMEQAPSKGDYSLFESGRHLQASVVVRQVGAKNGAGELESTAGYGLSLASRISLPWFERRDWLLLGGVAGRGVGRYIHDLEQLGGQDGVLDPVTGRVEALRAVSGYAAFEHWWTTVLRSTLAAGFVGVDNLDAQPHDALHKTKQLSLNLAWSPIRRLDLMSEVLWGRRRNKDGSRGDATQLQLGSTFRF